MKKLEKEVEEAHLTSSSTAAENEDQIAALNEQITIMQTALNEEEVKTTKLHEEMEVNVKVSVRIENER